MTSVPRPNTSTLIFCTTLPVPRAESSSAPLLTSVTPSPIVTRATSASVRIFALAPAPASAPPDTNDTLSCARMLLYALILIRDASVITPTVCTLADAPTVTLVLRVMRKSLEMPAALARPPVEPFTLGVETVGIRILRTGFGFSTSAKVGLSTLFVAERPISRARTVADAPMVASTAEITSLSTVTPAPAITPPALVISRVLRAAVCSAARLSSPVPRRERLTLLLAPIEASVLLVPEVAALAEAPAATPPLPAVVVA